MVKEKPHYKICWIYEDSIQFGKVVVSYYLEALNIAAEWETTMFKLKQMKLLANTFQWPKQ